MTFQGFDRLLIIDSKQDQYPAFELFIIMFIDDLNLVAPGLA